MTMVLHYTADRKALIDNATDPEALEIVKATYDDYVEYLEGKGFEIDRDSNRTTQCWSGDDWPDDVQDFWAWHN